MLLVCLNKPTGRSVIMVTSNKKVDTRNRILEAALEVFAEKGYHRANVDDIVSASNTSKGGFYFHFPSKRDLFITLIDEMGKILAGKIEGESSKGSNPREKAGLALRKGLHVFSKYRGLAKFLLIESFVSGSEFEEERMRIYRSLEKTIKSFLDEAKESGEIGRNVDTEKISALWVGAINHMVIRYLITDDRFDLAEDASEIERYLFRMVGW